MKKLIYSILIGLGLVAGGFAIATGATCTNVFPTSLNNYVSGNCVPSAWGNALEAKLGITGSSATSSLDYMINHIFTSYGSEQVASSALPWINYFTASSPSSTFLQTANNGSDVNNSTTFDTNIGALKATKNLSELTNTSTARSNLGAMYGGNNLSEVTNTSTARSNLGLGSISTFNSTDYLASTTNIVNTINGAMGNYSIVAGNNVTIATSTTSTVISVTTSASAAGSDKDVQFNSGGTFGADTGNFTYTSSTHQLGLNTATSSLVVGTNFSTSSVSVVLSYTGATSSWTVPAGVTSLTINAEGAVGGAGNTTTGGSGGSATGTITVTPGTTYYYCVGGSGGVGGSAGYCGGGGGTSSNGSGGGMSWFGTQSSFSTSTVIIVGGGGGGGGGPTTGNGGGGGGTTGVTGTNGSDTTGGGGGTQSAGGAAGTGSSSPSPTAGSVGQGGNGGGSSGGRYGGGGGGGYFGGGGGGGSSGGFGAGGGGGSSYVSPSMTATSTTSSTNNSTGTIKITYIISSLSQNTNYAGAFAGHLVSGYQSSTPTAPNGTIGGNDDVGFFTTTNSSTTYSMTFGQTWANNPPCFAIMSSGTAAYASKITASTSSVVFTWNTALATNSIFQYNCAIGY
ncbi:MAG: hypothetical protein KGL39_15045 [Patescibacteria group bacterium]|nr:hypothetical protein [Patescibacteria group bacterium]